MAHAIFESGLGCKMVEDKWSDFKKAFSNFSLGSVVRSLVVTDVLFGSFAYRRFDNYYSRQYNLLVESGKLEPKRPTNYYNMAIGKGTLAPSLNKHTLPDPNAVVLSLGLEGHVYYGVFGI